MIQNTIDLIKTMEFFKQFDLNLKDSFNSNNDMYNEFSLLQDPENWIEYDNEGEDKVKYRNGSIKLYATRKNNETIVSDGKEFSFKSK